MGKSDLRRLGILSRAMTIVNCRQTGERRAPQKYGRSKMKKNSHRYHSFDEAPEQRDSSQNLKTTQDFLLTADLRICPPRLQTVGFFSSGRRDNRMIPWILWTTEDVSCWSSFSQNSWQLPKLPVCILWNFQRFSQDCSRLLFVFVVEQIKFTPFEKGKWIDATKMPCYRPVICSSGLLVSAANTTESVRKFLRAPKAFRG